MHGLEAVTHVGQGPGHDDGHGVLQEGALHLVLDVDGLDSDQDPAPVLVVIAALTVVGGRLLTVAHMSRNLTSLALLWMKCLRNSTSSPMRMAVT